MSEEIYPVSHLEKVIAGEESPVTHLEKVIALYGGTGGSGGSGTTNYNVLLNKPSINGVTLSGNKTLAQLGIDLSKYTTADKAVTSIELVDAIPTGSTGTTTEKCLRLTFADSTVTPVDVSIANLTYDDTKIKADITSLQNNKVDKVTGKSLIDDTEIARLAKVDNYDDKAIKASIKTVADGLMASAGYSPDYKKLDIITVGGTKKSIDLLPIISHSKITDLSDVDSTNQGNGKTLVYNSATGKHEYVDSSSTDELVKMDSTSTAKHLGDLIDKTTIVNDNGTLVAKTLDGLTASITELNYIKGLQMPVQDLVTAFANGGLKTIDTPFPTYADLQSYDVSTLLDDIRYLVRVLADETHDGKITAYLIKKGQTAPTFYGYLSDSRDFKTNPIDLVNEITGKLKAKNIDADDLFALLTISDVYKTATAKDEIFGTHGAKAMYDELNTAIGKKAEKTDLTTHTGDTDIHTSTTEKDTWNTVTSKASKSDLTSHTGDTNIHITTAERTKWNNVDNKVNKTSIVTTIDSSSTDTQVPGALTVYNAIYNLVGLDKNTNILTIKRPSDELEGGEIHLETPTKGCTLIGSITIDTYGDYIRFFEGGGTHRGCRINLSKMKLNVLSSVCTTNVADVPKTQLTLNNGFTGTVIYEVKNGVCYVNLIAFKSEKTGNTLVVSDTLLPKPSIDVVTSTIHFDHDDAKIGMIYIEPKTDNRLRMHCYKANTNGWCTFSYPVSES